MSFPLYTYQQFGSDILRVFAKLEIFCQPRHSSLLVRSEHFIAFEYCIHMLHSLNLYSFLRLQEILYLNLPSLMTGIASIQFSDITTFLLTEREVFTEKYRTEVFFLQTEPVGRGLYKKTEKIIIFKFSIIFAVLF
jgi:hypothetical protein